MPKRTSTAAWQKTRRKVLETYPTCYWCGKAPSTEADHLIEYAAGGSDDESNLVGSCKKCNGRRGQAFREQRDRNRIKARDAAVQAKTAQAQAHVLYHDRALPPTPSDSHFGQNRPGSTRTSRSRSKRGLTGHDQPRLESPRLGTDSYGPAVAEWARRNLQVELMPWQIHALEGQLEYVVDAEHEFGWRWARRESLISTARQQGKTVALMALIGWWLTDYAKIIGRQVNVLSVANALDRAEAIFTMLAPRLQELYGGRAVNQIGRKTLRLDTGTWEVRAASPRLHGGSYSLIVVDELWNVTAATLDEALRPSQIAQANPLLSMWSTAGDQSSESMIDYRERALIDIDRGQLTAGYFAEWSMPPSVDPLDEQFWGYANPALGRTITIEALRAASTKDGFVRAHLNQWVAARGAWLDPGIWEALGTMRDMPAGGILAVDSSMDEQRYVGVRAGLVADSVVVDLAFATDNEPDLWKEIERIMGADKQLLLAITPALATHLPVQLSRRFEVVGYAELILYTALVRSMIMEGRVEHRGSSLLSEHITRAVSTKANTGLVLSSQKSPGPIEAARCAVWAVGMASKARNNQRPILVIAG